MSQGLCRAQSATSTSRSLKSWQTKSTRFCPTGRSATAAGQSSSSRPLARSFWRFESPDGDSFGAVLPYEPTTRLSAPLGPPSFSRCCHVYLSMPVPAAEVVCPVKAERPRPGRRSRSRHTSLSKAAHAMAPSECRFRTVESPSILASAFSVSGSFSRVLMRL